MSEKELPIDLHPYQKKLLNDLMNMDQDELNTRIFSNMRGTSKRSLKQYFIIDSLTSLNKYLHDKICTDRTYLPKDRTKNISSNKYTQPIPKGKAKETKPSKSKREALRAKRKKRK